jgi:hypothetical protein
VNAHSVLRRRGSHIFSKTTGSQMAVSLSALRAGRPLSPKKIPGTRGYNAAVIIRLAKNSSDVIENQSLHFPACSVVPQPTTLPRSP